MLSWSHKEQGGDMMKCCRKANLSGSAVFSSATGERLVPFSRSAAFSSCSDVGKQHGGDDFQYI